MTSPKRTNKNVIAPTFTATSATGERLPSGNAAPTTTVESRMIMMLMKLFRTRIVANRFLGPLSMSGSSIRFRILFADGLSSSRKEAKSEGPSEKYATSEPETSAEHANEISMPRAGIKNEADSKFPNMKERRSGSGSKSVVFVQH